MKKLVSVLLVLLICLSCIFAYQNTYRLSSEEVQTFLLLRKMSHTITPDPTYPISASQLAELMKSLNTENLTESEKSLYDSLLKKLESPEVLFARGKAGIDTDIILMGGQLFKSLDPNEYTVLPFNQRMPMGEITATMYMGEYMTGVFDLAARDKISSFEVGSSKPKFSSLKNFMEYSEGTPDYAYASLGYKNLNFVVGRDRLGAGNGFTGNLELGENILFDNFLKLSYVGDLLSYDFTIDSFARDDKNYNGIDDNLGNVSVNAMKKNIFLHRVSFNICNKVSVSVYEGALVHSQNPFQDIQFLNPFMFMHNTGSYYEADTNNFAGLEVVSVLPANSQLDAQLFVDQLGDKEYGETAFAGLLNFSTTRSLEKGILNVYAETVYGNPYVYLKNSHGFGMDPVTFVGWENLDLVNDAKSDYNRGNSRDLQYLGYRFGGDLFSVGIGASYIFDNSKITLDIQSIKKGTNGIWKGESREALNTEGTKMNVLTAFAGYDVTLLKGIDIKAKAGIAKYKNYHHEAGNKLDFQYSIGVCVRPLEFIKNKTSL